MLANLSLKGRSVYHRLAAAASAPFTGYCGRQIIIKILNMFDNGHGDSDLAMVDQDVLDWLKLADNLD